jgi:hypothetical protein
LEAKNNVLFMKGVMKMITKTLIVVNGMTGKESRIKVQEGTKPAEVLSKVGLPNYQLARVKDRRVLRPGCDLAREVRDCERLFAFAPMVVGGLL